MSLTFALIIQAHPLSAGAHHAVTFTQHLLHAGHQVKSVFFFQEGVLTASCNASVPSGECDVYTLWQTMHSSTPLPLTCCIVSAQRRGLQSSQIDPRFTLAGLAQFMAAAQQADRCVQFHD